MFRRLRRAAFQANTVSPDQMRILNQANLLIANGHPEQAGPLFANLAGEMENTAHPRRAANLHAQAAHAFADSHNEQSAVNHARIALNLFIQYKMVNRTSVFYTNITRKLTNKEMKAAADTLIIEFGSRAGSISAQAVPGPQPRGQLPTNCPKCGGPVHKNDANWLDDQIVECDYCGALIQSQ
jgi:hypothetical protein